jgi:dihydrofolate reductase
MEGGADASPADREIGDPPTRTGGPMPAEVVYLVAASLDGFIAHPDGSFDGFVWDDALVEDFMGDIASFGAVVMGRRTYDAGLAEGKTSPYPGRVQIVASRTMTASPDADVELVRDDLVGRVRRLRDEVSAPVWICGGGDVAGQLAAAGLIDRVVVKCNPVVFGDGIPLFGRDTPRLPLTLESIRRFDESGILKLSYRVASRP